MSQIDKPDEEQVYTRIQSQIQQYPDVSTILTKLKSDQGGYYSQIYSLIFNMFQNEHEFQMQEIIKIAQQQQQENYQEDVFDFLDTYNMNSEIYKQSIMVIFGIIIDDVFKYFNQGVSQAFKDIRKQEGDLGDQQDNSSLQQQYQQQSQQEQLNQSPARAEQFHASLANPIKHHYSNLEKHYKELPKHQLYHPSLSGVRDQDQLQKTLGYLKQFSGIEDLEQNKVIQEYMKYANIPELQQQQEQNQQQQDNQEQQYQQQMEQQQQQSQQQQQQQQQYQEQQEQIPEEDELQQQEVTEFSNSQNPQQIRTQNSNIKVSVSKNSRYSSSRKQEQQENQFTTTANINNNSRNYSKKNINNNSQLNMSGSYNRKQSQESIKEKIKQMPQSFGSQGGAFSKAQRLIDDPNVKNPGVGYYDIGGNLQNSKKQGSYSFGKSQKQSIFTETSKKYQGPQSTYDPDIRYLSNASFNRSK